MTKVAFLLLFISLLLSADIALGQGSFLKEGQSGFGLTAFVKSGENYTGYGGDIGYSFAAKFDLGLIIGRTNFENIVIGRNGKGTSYSPYATLTLLKPSKISRIGIELNASYGIGNYTSDDLEAQNLDLNEEGINAGGTIYMKMETSPDLDIFPRVSIAYVKIDQKLDDPSGNSETESIENVGYIVGIYFLFSDKVVVGPDFTTNDGNNSFRLSIGWVIPTS